MIDDEDFEDIADIDSMSAFVRLERKYRTAAQSRMINSRTEKEAIVDYMNHALTAAEVLEVPIAGNWHVPSDDDDDLEITFRVFTTQMDRMRVRAQIAAARPPKNMALDDAAKNKLRAYVDQIKIIIDASDLEVSKKERLLNLINKFLAELDRHRTPFHAFSDLMIAFAHLGGQMAEEAEPAWKWFRLIGEVLGAKQEEHQSALSKPQTPKQIEHHKKD